jgi:hypothetical protein
METKLLRLNYLHTSKGEVHIQVRIEAILLIIPVVFVILILLRIYGSSLFHRRSINHYSFSTLHIYRKFSVPRKSTQQKSSRENVTV